MKTFYRLLLLSALIISSTNLSVAQNTKNEVEKSITKEELPPSVVLKLNGFWNEEKKADFYRQSDGEKISYEVKFDWENHLYSVEFDSSGTLIDIEQLLEFDELPQTLRNTITEEIDKQYSKFRITRVQRQFSALQKSEGNNVIEEFLERNFDGLFIRYEIEIDGQNKEELGSFELLFGVNGNLIQKRKIVRRSLDNIW
jgi:hypothetical protein